MYYRDLCAYYLAKGGDTSRETSFGDRNTRSVGCILQCLASHGVEDDLSGSRSIQVQPGQKLLLGKQRGGVDSYHFVTIAICGFCL